MTNLETAHQIWKEIDKIGKEYEQMSDVYRDCVPELKAQAKQHLEDCERFLEFLENKKTFMNRHIANEIKDLQSAISLHKERLGEKK